MDKQNIHLIMNPTSAGGKTGKSRQYIFDKIKYYLGKNYTLWLTEKPADAIRHTVSAIERGGNLIIAVGGDGTIHEVVNGICSKGVGNNNHSTLGIISSGTGQDFVQSLGLTTNIDEQLKIIKNGHTENIDIGSVKFIDKSGEEVIRYFANEFQVGIGGDVVNKVNSTEKHKGGLLTYGLATVFILFKYSGYKMILRVNDEEPFSGSFIGVIVANGKRMGGGMKLNVSGKLNDHHFDLILIHSQNFLRKAINFPKIYFGKLKSTSGIIFGKINNIKIESEHDVLMEADGELLGKLPCEVNLLPSAIKVIANFDN